VKLRLPLYLRILGLFALNILLLAGALLAVFRMQFHLGLDSFLAGQANRRVQALSQVVIRELQQSPANETGSVLERFQQAFDLDLYVFRADGQQIAGEPVTLPPQIERATRAALGWRGRGGPGGPGMGFQRGPRSGQPGPPETGAPPDAHPPPEALWAEPLDPMPPDFEIEPPDRLPEPEAGRRPGPRWLVEGAGRPLLPAGFFLKSTQPTRYWAGTFFLSRPPAPGAQPQVLLIVSDSITGGGLFFDWTPWLVAGLGALALSALLWLPFVRSVTRSLGRMTHATTEISRGRFETRVPSKRTDELGRLAEAINDMAGRLQGFVGGQRRFLGDIAHELCSPLARIQTALGILEQRASPTEQAYVKDLQEEAEHMARLVGELLSFSKASLDATKIQLSTVALADVAAQAIRREQREGVQLLSTIPPDLHALAQAELLQRALANLLRNAIRYAGSAGPITLTAWRENAQVVIEVADHGPGVPEESLARLFDPFYRVDASRTRETGGVGLGLTIVKACVESCGGTVTASNRPEGGLCVQIRLRLS
jgi:two-component system sensor histidine kinase CpxA